MSAPHRLTLYGKPGCHLCEELRLLVDELQPSYGYVVEEIDITRDPALDERYRHEIPVVWLDGRERLRGRISEAELVGVLRGMTKDE
ncbi:MAG: glutaredoxin family protein [Acidobacteriota bacterium]